MMLLSGSLDFRCLVRFGNKNIDVRTTIGICGRKYVYVQHQDILVITLQL